MNRFPEATRAVRSLRAARLRIFETPPRSLTAFCRPPPCAAAMSRRNRKMSKRLDLPDAFGPTTNCRSRRSTSIALKFLQFLALRWLISIDSALHCTGEFRGRQPI